MKSGLLLAILLLAPTAAAQTRAVGDRIEPFSLEDQHGEAHEVDASIQVILFSRDMAGGKLLKEALADDGAGLLERRGAVYVADISGMPSLVARLFALPSMRERPYAMLLDRDGSATAQLPDREERATVIVLDALEIQRVEHLETAGEILRALEPSGPRPNL